MSLEQLRMIEMDDIRKVVLESIKPVYLPSMSDNTHYQLQDNSKSVKNCTLRQRNVFVKK